MGDELWRGRVCGQTGSAELLVGGTVSGGCATHRGSTACLRTAAELWAETRRGTQRERAGEERTAAAVRLLDEFDRMAVDSSDPVWGYGGSPFQRRVTVFLESVGRRRDGQVVIGPREFRTTPL
jgi:hypothetical protein